MKHHPNPNRIPPFQKMEPRKNWSFRCMSSRPASLQVSHHLLMFIPCERKKSNLSLNTKKQHPRKCLKNQSCFNWMICFFDTGKGLFNETSVLNWLFGFQVGTNQGCLLEVSVNDDHSNHLEQTPNSKKHKTI